MQQAAWTAQVARLRNPGGTFDELEDEFTFFARLPIASGMVKEEQNTCRRMRLRTILASFDEIQFLFKVNRAAAQLLYRLKTEIVPCSRGIQCLQCSSLFFRPSQDAFYFPLIPATEGEKINEAAMSPVCSEEKC